MAARGHGRPTLTLTLREATMQAALVLNALCVLCYGATAAAFFVGGDSSLGWLNAATTALWALTFALNWVSQKHDAE